MTQQADSLALSPFMFGEVFFAGAVAMQKQIAEGMMAMFDAVADAMSESVRAAAALAHGVGNAERPSEAAAAGVAWFQGRVEKTLAWWWTLAERVACARAPAAKAPEPIALPAPQEIRRAPVVPQIDAPAATKPPAGKLRRTAPAVVAKLPKKPARPTAK
jgi:hypothetical protein